MPPQKRKKVKKDETVEVMEIWEVTKTGEGFLVPIKLVAQLANGMIMKLYDGYVANVTNQSKKR